MSDQQFRPFVPPDSTLKEFTVRALLLGLIMCVVLGAANAYLGLKAGMTIAATYPAAVIGMAVLKLFKGSVLEENFARTVGSIGESVAAGAIFTIPAFVMLGYFDFGLPAPNRPDGMAAYSMGQQYMLSTAMMILGGLLGIMFVTILRRVMVEDRSLPFPESVAASEIHKAGQRGADAAMQLFKAMGVGAVIKLLDGLGVFRASNDFMLGVGKIGSALKLSKGAPAIASGGMTRFSAPAVTPAYVAVGYIIGPELGALNFAGGLLAWGLFVPLLVYFLGPGMFDGFVSKVVAEATAAGTAMTAAEAAPQAWGEIVTNVYMRIVRPVAVGGMLVGACYTLFRMRKNLVTGVQRGIADVRKAAGSAAPTVRTERDLSFKTVLLGLVVLAVLMTGLYFYFTGVIGPAILAMIVILVTGFFFAAVSGNLVGTIGSSNNPISGLTLATTLIAALTMYILHQRGPSGIMAALGVAAVGCVSAAVAGEMLQDLKVGHILGGTPWRMQVGDIIGVVVSGLVLFFPLYVLHTSDIKAGGIGFGGPNLAAPQAGLMAALSSGIVGGEMAWPLILVGIAMGVSLILIKVRSPMLFSVGMYLPLETTFAIFVGGLIRGIVEKLIVKRSFNDAQKARTENAGVLSASGFIAGEALMGLFIAAIVFFFDKFPQLSMFSGVAGWLAIPVLALLALYLVYVPLSKAGRADEPAPPMAVM